MGSVQIEGTACMKTQRQEGLRPKFWKEDIVLEHSEEVTNRESGKYKFGPDPRPCHILKAMVKLEFYSKYTWKSF